MKKGYSKYIIFLLLIVLIISSLIIIKNKQTPKEIVIKASALRLEETINYTEELKVDIENGNDINIKTKTKDAYLIDNYKNKYLFYFDNNEVKVYNTFENKSYTIDKIKPEYTTDFVIDDNDNFIGVIYSTDLNEHNSYLLIDGNEVLYNQKYDYLVSLGSKYLTASKYDKNGKQLGAYLLNATKEEKPLIKKEYKTDEYYGFYELGKKYITFEFDNIIEIYDIETLKLIYKTKSANTVDNEGNSRFIVNADSNDTIYIYDYSVFKELDNKGNVIKTNKNINGCVDLIDKYVMNTNNKKLTITDIDNNIFQIANLNNGKLDYYEYIKMMWR